MLRVGCLYEIVIVRILKGKPLVSSSDVQPGNYDAATIELYRCNNNDDYQPPDSMVIVVGDWYVR